MNPIMLAILIVAGVGLVAGLVLAVASVVMAVPRDEKVEAVRDALPGANCGACGYSGCDGYAHALVHEGAKVGLCSPGGAETAEKTSTLLGVSGTVEVKTAMCAAAAVRRIRRASWTITESRPARRQISFTAATGNAITAAWVTATAVRCANTGLLRWTTASPASIRRFAAGAANVFRFVRRG